MKKPTNREIKHALHAHMPSLDWAFSRGLPGETKSVWRSFKAKRHGIRYNVDVLSPWDGGSKRAPEYVFFIDGECVLALNQVDHDTFAVRCAAIIKKVAQLARDRADKLEDALKSRLHERECDAE